MFKPSNFLEESLGTEPRDMYDIVGALMGYIYADPWFKTSDLEEAIKYVLENGVTESELFTPFDSKLAFEENKKLWTPEYYSYARVYLKDNFCMERIKHVQAIAEELHPQPAMQSEQSKKPDMGRTHSSAVDSTQDKKEPARGGYQSNEKKRRTSNVKKRRRLFPKRIIVGIACLIFGVMLVLIFGVMLVVIITHTTK